MNIVPVEGYVLAEVKKEEPKAIYVQEEHKREKDEAIILEVGPKVEQFKKGDTILFKESYEDNKTLELNKRKLVLIKLKHIVAKIEGDK